MSFDTLNQPLLYARNHDFDKISSPFIVMKSIHRHLILSFLWVYLLLVMVLALINQTIGAEWVVPALSLVILVHILPLIYYNASYGWFHPLIFGTLQFIFDLLRGFPIYVWGLESHKGLPEYSHNELAYLVAYGLLLTMIGQLSYYMGFFIHLKLPQIKTKFNQLKNAVYKITLINTIALILFGVYLQSQGGIVSHLIFLSRGRRYLIDEGLLTGEWTILVRIAALGCLIWLVVDTRVLRNPWFAISSFFALISQYLVSGSRSSIIDFMVIGLIAWMLKNKKLSLIPLSVIVLVGVLLIGTLGQFRSSVWGGTVDWSAVTNQGVRESFISGINEIISRSSEQSPLYPVLARVPTEVPLLYGTSYYAIIATPIPRAIWSEKPRTIGAAIGEIFLNTPAPIPPDPITEAYWNFHIPGIIFIFFLYGIFHQWLVLTLQKYAKEPLSIIFYSITLYYLNPTTLDIVRWIQILVSLIIILILLGAISYKKYAIPN